MNLQKLFLFPYETHLSLFFYKKTTLSAKLCPHKPICRIHISHNTDNPGGQYNQRHLHQPFQWFFIRQSNSNNVSTRAVRSKNILAYLTKRTAYLICIYLFKFFVCKLLVAIFFYSGSVFTVAINSEPRTLMEVLSLCWIV